MQVAAPSTLPLVGRVARVASGVGSCESPPKDPHPHPSPQGGGEPTSSISGQTLRMTGAKSLRLTGSGFAKRRLRRREPRDWHTEWRARHIVQPALMTERDRGRVAAVLAANPDF